MSGGLGGIYALKFDLDVEGTKQFIYRIVNFIE